MTRRGLARKIPPSIRVHQTRPRLTSPARATHPPTLRGVTTHRLPTGGFVAHGSSSGARGRGRFPASRVRETVGRKWFPDLNLAAPASFRQKLLPRFFTSTVPPAPSEENSHQPRQASMASILPSPALLPPMFILFIITIEIRYLGAARPGAGSPLRRYTFASLPCLQPSRFLVIALPRFLAEPITLRVPRNVVRQTEPKDSHSLLLAASLCPLDRASATRHAVRLLPGFL
jgi:hypothetical protein